jgi:hypothetical protein
VVGGLQGRGSSELLPEGCAIGHWREGVWTFDTDDVACGPLERVWVGRGPDDVWAEGGGAVVHWNGRYLTKNPRQKPAPRRGLHGAAGGWRLTVDGGEGALQRAGSPTLVRTRDFWAFGPDDVWAIQAGILRHFDGRSWGAGVDNAYPLAVAARSPADLWMAADGPTSQTFELWHFDGTRWSSSTVPRGEHEMTVALAAPAGGDVWLLTSSRLRRFDGRRWTTATIPAGVTGRALLARSNADVWVGGDGVVLHWDGKAITSHTAASDVRQLWGDGDQLWAAPPVQRWNGSAFVPISQLDTPLLKMARVARAGDVLWLIARDQVARWQGGKLELIPINVGELEGIHAGAAGDLWLATGETILHAPAGASPVFQTQDSVGVGAIKALGGGAGLLWVIGQQGLLLRNER